MKFTEQQRFPTTSLVKNCKKNKVFQYSENCKIPLNVYSKKPGFNGERKVNAKKTPKLKYACYHQHFEEEILPLIISRDMVSEN